MKTSRLAFPVCLIALLAGAPVFAAAQSNKPLTGSMLDQPQPAAPPQAAQTYPLGSSNGQSTPFGEETVTGRVVPAPSPAPIAVAQAAPPPEPVAQPAPVAEPQPAPKPREFGRTTHDLLKLQASGEAAGKKQPILGDEASASYKRYLDSFNHPLPERYQTAVKTEGSSGN